MNKLYKIILLTWLFSSSVLAQAPNKMSYQAVIRNTSNNLMVNQAVGMRISILQATATGTAVYAETQTTTSNANGLVTLEIGGGNPVTGTFAAINWANGPYFIKTETDPAGGTSYTITGTTQLMSVPYAMYAATSGNATPGPQGNPGTNGTNGQNTLAKTTSEAAGANCATGGVKLEYGLDANANGTLDASEINVVLTRYICNGAAGTNGTNGTNGTAGTNGTNGLSTLAKTTSEAAGANCATGGVKLEYGLDANANGTLDAGEINVALTRYICNGAQGSTGAQGVAGTNGTNGQGVPTGGTAGQVLSKVDGTNYNTQWITPSGGGTALPSQTGNAGKYLKTDGTDLSWGAAPGASYELYVTKTAAQAQTTNVGSSLVLPDVITFSSTNDTNAALTGGNTWNGATGTFTVGATGGGLYLVDISLVGNIAYCAPMIDMNGTGNSGSSHYGMGLINNQTFQTPHKARGQMQKLIYMNPDEYFIIRGTSGTTVAGADLSTDGTTNLRIIKVK